MKRLWLALTLWSGAAAAQPMLAPGRDVAVVYRLEGAAADRIPGGAPDGVRLWWDAAGQRLRAEPIGRPIYALADLGRRVAEIVFAPQNAYMEMRLKAGDPQTLLAGRDARFVRRGTQRLLGLDCTDWTVHAPKFEGSGCVTVDGVVLRAEGLVDGRPGSVTAMSVGYGPVAGQLLVPPAGAQRLAFQ